MDGSQLKGSHFLRSVEARHVSREYRPSLNSNAVAPKVEKNGGCINGGCIKDSSHGITSATYPVRISKKIASREAIESRYDAPMMKTTHSEDLPNISNELARFTRAMQIRTTQFC